MDKDKPSNPQKAKSSPKGREPQQAPDKPGAKAQEAARKGGQHGQGGRS
jgi:hypothetical protein